MDFTPTEASTDLAGLTKDILASLTQERLRDNENGERIDRALWAALGSAGVLEAALPVSVGGGGFGLLEQCAVLIELGRAVAPVPYLDSVVVAAAALARFGDQVTRDRWATPAATGAAILTAALAEEYGEDPTNPATLAQRTDDGWLLSGAKASVPYAPVANALLVPARTDVGVAVFVVTPDDPGVTVTPVDLVDLGSAGWLDLDRVRVSADRLIGGAEVVEYLATVATVGRCARQLGVLEQALALTAEHARTRVQFDRPIAAFQAVTQRLADAYIDVEAVRLTLWQAAWRVSAGLPARAEVATAKFWAADAGHRVAHTAVHIHGGMGIDTDHALHRYFIAAKRNEFELGSATTQLRRLGALLADEPA
ncbi:MAG TPA: acyl-CoA dehydrogenase family protein [Pseudonocardiaceae bacterium]|nr:acyl-CoA dehydrogenase family protein [Pseudonocardiaceae bacterium]